MKNQNGKWENINNILKYSDLKHVNDTNIDYSDKKLEFFVGLESIREGGVYQLKKSTSNNSDKKISSWSEDYEGYGGEEGKFDETNEVFRNDFTTLFLHKISSIEFNELFNKKFNEYFETTNEDFWFNDFCEWLSENGDEEYHGFDPTDYGSVFDLLTLLSIPNPKIETVIEDQNIDMDYNIISWCTWNGTSEDNIYLLYKKIED